MIALLPEYHLSGAHYLRQKEEKEKIKGRERKAKK